MQEKERRKENEFELMAMIKGGKFEEIESKLKPSAFMFCETNSLVMGMKVCGYFCVPGLRQVVFSHLLGPVKGLI